MKRKKYLRIFAIALSILFLIPCVSVFATAEKAVERTYPANIPQTVFLTYDSTTSAPAARVINAAITNMGNVTEFRPYTDWQNVSFGTENGFLTLKPQKTNSGFIVDLVFSGYLALRHNDAKFFTMYFKVVGEDVEETVNVVPIKKDGTMLQDAAATAVVSAKGGKWNYIKQTASTADGDNAYFNTGDGGQQCIRLQFSGLQNENSYIVLDYFAWVANEENAELLKKNHDDYVEELENPFTATYKTRAERGIARENVLYFDGYSKDNMTAGYCYSTADNGLMNGINGNIQFVNPGQGAYDDFDVGLTADGHIKLTITKKIHGGAVLVKTPGGYDPNLHGTVIGMRYKVEKADGSAMAEVTTDIANGNNVQDRSKGTLKWQAGIGWQHAVGTLSSTALGGFGIWLPEELRVAGTVITLDYIGFFKDVATAEKEYKIQSVADGVDIGLAGVQTKTVTAEDGTQTRSLRFVGVLDDYQDAAYGDIGFELTQNGVKNKKPIVIEKVYQEIQAAGKPVTAESLGGKYLFTFCVDGLALTEGNTTYTVTTYAVVNGVRVVGATYTFCYQASTDSFSQAQ